ncbi:19915_t:CDS:2, partial [Racocetra persica]
VKNIISLQDTNNQAIIDQNTIDQDTIDQDTIDQDTVDQDTVDQDIVDQDIDNQYMIDENTLEVTVTHLTELKVTVVIDTKKTCSLAEKWLTFKDDEINNFYLFKSSLNSHIQKYLDLRFIYNDDYEITYKVNGQGQAMCINNREDFLSFVDKYKKPDNLAKIMYLYTILKNPEQFHKRKSENTNNDEKKKKSKTSNIPKESDLNEDEYNQAQLNSSRLTLWARDI